MMQKDGVSFCENSRQIQNQSRYRRKFAQSTKMRREKRLYPVIKKQSLNTSHLQVEKVNDRAYAHPNYNKK